MNILLCLETICRVQCGYMDGRQEQIMALPEGWPLGYPLKLLGIQRQLIWKSWPPTARWCIRCNVPEIISALGSGVQWITNISPVYLVGFKGSWITICHNVLILGFQSLPTIETSMGQRTPTDLIDPLKVVRFIFPNQSSISIRNVWLVDLSFS